MKLCIIQAVLPLYAIAFFNRIVELYPDIDLVVLADLKTSQPLNQYRQEICVFRALHLDNIEHFGVVFRPGILGVLRSLQPDIVIFSGSTRDLSQLWVMFLFRLSGIAFGAWGMFHRVGGPRFVSKLYYRFVGMLATCCLTYTRTGATNLVNIGVSKHKIVVVGTAIDERIPFAEARALTPEALATFKLDKGVNGKHIILQVVRLSRIKRPELLILAASELLIKRKDFVFILVGDGEMREELEQMIAERNLQDNFRLLGAIYDESVLSYWYMCAEAFVVPTFIGLSAHHAMSYGVPVVTDDSLDSQGSEFDILAEGLNSLTYREGDTHDLALVLERIISDKALQASLSSNARRTVELIHNLNNKTHRFVNHVLELNHS